MNSDWLMISVGVAILVFLWGLHRDMAGLREGMARIEGIMEGVKDALAGKIPSH